MEKIIDLHIHTNISDGALSPKEVIDEAFKNGVHTISICDHDTIEAYNEELFDYAKKKNIQLIPGVEISTKFKKIGVHILGYNFDYTNTELRNKLGLLRNARHDYLYNVAKKLSELGYQIDVESLDQVDAVTKAHIAGDAVTNPNNQEKLKEEFGYIPSKGEFIETIMNEGCPAYVKKETINPKEVAELIRQASGKVVLAHPVAYQNEDNFTDQDILELVEELKADGIEANYIYVNRHNEVINDSEKWNKFAEEHNLVSTIGSDFHNKDGLHAEIGFANINFKLNGNKVQQIINYLLEK